MYKFRCHGQGFKKKIVLHDRLVFSQEYQRTFKLCKDELLIWIFSDM